MPGDRGVHDRNACSLSCQAHGQRPSLGPACILALKVMQVRPSAELGLERTAPQADQFDLEAHRLAECARQIQRQKLGAMRIGVMRHQDDAATPIWYVGLAGQRIARGLQIGIAITPVRLQMRALRPFVPGVDEHQSMVRLLKSTAGVGDRVGKPCLVALRRTVEKHPSVTAFSSGVVPSRVDRSEDGMARRIIFR